MPSVMVPLLVTLATASEKAALAAESTTRLYLQCQCEELGLVGARRPSSSRRSSFPVQGFYRLPMPKPVPASPGTASWREIARQVLCNIAVVTNTPPNRHFAALLSSGGTSPIPLLAYTRQGFGISDAIP